MRIAIVSDIHGNLTAFEAVLKDLRDTAPDLILHGGDLAGPGSSPVEIVDQIRALGWPGVYGNTDEMLFNPQSLTNFAASMPQLKSMFGKIAEMADWLRDRLGPDRVAWLNTLPEVYIEKPVALVHASPASTWRVGSEADLEALGQPLAVYGHTHLPFVKSPFVNWTIANAGSVGQPYDGDRRASYLLIDSGAPAIRRVEYDVEKELKALNRSGLPHAEWMVRTLESASPQMP